MDTIKLIRLLLITIVFTGQITAQSNDFVKLDGKRFKCGQSDFFPIVANYGISVFHLYGAAQVATFPTHFPCRFSKNFPNGTPGLAIQSQQNAFDIMRRDFEALKLKGINTVRIYGDIEYNKPCKTWQGGVCTEVESSPGIISSDQSCGDIRGMVLTTDAELTLLLDIIENVLEAARQAELKVIVLTSKEAQVATDFLPEYVNYLEEFAKRFKYNKTLLAVDLFNEPAGCWLRDLTKTQICDITNSWNNAIKSNSQILTTVGLAGTEDVLGWDPNVLNIDFASFHNYVNKDDASSDLGPPINQVKKDFYWFSHALSIPWIVGELGFDAAMSQVSYPLNSLYLNGNINGTIYNQKQFFNETIAACRDYGGAGYSWWVFMDEVNGPWWGLAELHDGYSSSAYSWKPVVDDISTFNSTPVPANATIPSDYYNYHGLTPNFSKSGTVLNVSTNQPIENAVVFIYDNNGNWVNRTFTDSWGNFTAVSNVPITALKISAVDCNETYVTSPGSPQSYFLTKIIRPTAQSLSYNNQNVSNVSVNAFAINDINFNNYQIASGNFSAKAGSVIHLNTGFVAQYGTNFNARIGPYYHDCGSLTSGGNPFRTIPQNSESVSEKESGIICFPNPGEGLYTVSLNATEENKNKNMFIEVYNPVGALVRSVPVTNSKQQIDIKDLSSGIYLFAVRSESGVIKNFKVIKN